MEIEQLRRTSVAPALEMEVTTVTRQESTVGRSPAAVFVITPEMIRRSGAQTIPDVLRMAPGLIVAQRDANKWAISSRGFNQVFAKTLLIQIDGRTVYTPVFEGTFWDVQDVVLEDIERIEVIRGPGATLWGANAVNGIINIITKSAKDTTGIYAKAGGGTEEDGFSTVRVGGCQGDLAYRGYFKWFERDRAVPVGPVAHDDWRQRRGGFRTDWTPSCRDTLTLQGDVYAGTSGMTFLGFVPLDDTVEGHNVLSRWKRTIDDQRDLSLQVYYDATDRQDDIITQHVEVFDVDFQARFPWRSRHNVIWGLQFRRAKDFLPSPLTSAIRFSPTGDVNNLYSGFIQDEVTLREDLLYLTLGTKLEKNDFTGFEVQPNVRLLWLPSDRQVVWGSIARAVRTPSRFSEDASLLAVSRAGPSRFGPSPRFKAEELIAYELGYRAQPVEQFAWDLSLFYNVYQNLEFWEGTGIKGPLTLFELDNDARAHGYGLELSGEYRVTKHWKLRAWYAFLRLVLQEPITLAPRSERIEGSSPHHQAFLMSSWDLARDLEFDLLARYVDELPSQVVPSYLSLDLRLGWRPGRNVEFSVVGKNLLDSSHLEFGSLGGSIPGPLAEIPRGVYGYVKWRY